MSQNVKFLSDSMYSLKNIMTCSLLKVYNIYNVPGLYKL